MPGTLFRLERSEDSPHPLPHEIRLEVRRWPHNATDELYARNRVNLRSDSGIPIQAPTARGWSVVIRPSSLSLYIPNRPVQRTVYILDCLYPINSINQWEPHTRTKTNLRHISADHVALWHGLFCFFFCVLSNGVSTCIQDKSVICNEATKKTSFEARDECGDADENNYRTRYTKPVLFFTHIH